MNKLITIFSAVVFFACTQNKQDTTTLTGQYRAYIQLKDKEMPFLLDLKEEGEKISGHLINGEERILLDDITTKDDSVLIPMHIFDASIIATISGGRLQGEYVKHFEDDYRLAFRAERGIDSRFPPQADAAVDFSGRYDLVFHQETGELHAIALLRQNGNQLSGTIMTATGDYRYLAGHAFSEQFELSTFDGDNLYLIEGRMTANGKMEGTFWSGKSRKDSWTATANPDAQLTDAGSLTYLKEGYEQIEFSFPNLKKEMVNFPDEYYKDKVVILQIFGTWCPNCMDETKFLAPWYKENKERGVEIIALSFELKDDFDYAKKRIERMKEKLDVPYEFLVAGTSDKESASQALPMLNHIMSFPTTIFIDKKGEVRKIHTGFTGPGTGQPYKDFITDFNKIMDELLGE